jgi:hypothetical protein
MTHLATVGQLQSDTFWHTWGSISYCNPASESAGVNFPVWHQEGTKQRSQQAQVSTRAKLPLPGITIMEKQHQSAARGMPFCGTYE